jgi:hypothetical protein
MQPELDNSLKRELHEAITDLWKEKPDVTKWNDFWLRHCTFLGQWMLPDGMDLHLPMELGANIYGRNWTGINLSRLTLKGEKNFSNHNLRKAQFQHADLRGSAFVWADLREANLEAANLAGANFTGADLTGANLRGARLKGAKLSHAKLDRADLRLAQDIEFDENAIYRTHFTSRVGLAWRFAPLHQTLPEGYADWNEPFGKIEDRWSKLRRTYTGPRFALLLR